MSDLAPESCDGNVAVTAPSSNHKNAGDPRGRLSLTTSDCDELEHAFYRYHISQLIMEIALCHNTSQIRLEHEYTRGKMNTYSREQPRQSSASTSPPAIPIATVINENWRGKNDPAERRRIQNRLNQRAFRQRQRAGEQSKQYKPRSTSSASDDQQDESASSEDEGESPEAKHTTPFKQYGASAATASSTGERPEGMRDPQGRVWDELAQLINRNFMSAVVSNAQQLGIDVGALRSTTPSMTPRSGSQVPGSLKPVELQHQVAHDPVIDTIPHPRLRFNILSSLARGQLDAAAFSRCVRGSGALEEANGNWQRSGLVVWTCPETIESWELSESFVKRWAALLRGCEDLIAATNAWRSRRGERAFHVRTAETRS